MVSTHRWLLNCTIAALVSFAAPALVLAQGFSDDFESYTAGQPLPGPPWYNWEGGTLVTVDGVRLYDEPGNGANGSAKFIGLGEEEPVRWFDTPFDVKDRIVDFTFYLKSSSTAQFDMFAGSMEGAPGPYERPGKQYGINIGAIYVVANIGDNTGTVTYANQQLSNFVGDAVTWNEIRIRLINRSLSGRMGTGELFVNGVRTNQEYIWKLDAEGFNGVDFYGEDWARGYLLDDISIVQNGMADPLPYAIPDYVYPGVRTTSGGITSDGVRYLYVLGGENSAGTAGSTELWRFDTVDETWTQLQSNPPVPDPLNPEAVLTSMVERAALTTAGAQGKLSLTLNAYDHGGDHPWQIEYDVATAAWSEPTSPGPGLGSHDVFLDAAAMGNRIYASINPSQGGALIYDAETRTFLSRQGDPNRFPYGVRYGMDFAYADDGNNWLYGLGGRDRDPDPEVDDWVGIICRYDVTQAPPGTWDAPGGVTWYSDLPVAWPNPGYQQGQHALTYVPEGINTIYFLHGEWGDAGLYKVQVEGGALFAAVGKSDDLYRYDIATDTWTTLVDAIPFVFGDVDFNDDMTFGCPVSDIPGDVDGNGVVDGLDLTAVLTAWETTPGDPLWNENADLDDNNVVDGLDLTEVISNWTVASAAAAPEAVASEVVTSDTTTKRGPGNVARGKGNVKRNN